MIDAASERDRASSRRRVLIVADADCGRGGGCAAHLREAASSVDALVVAPAHDGGGSSWVVDETEAVAEATRRLRTCEACLAGSGIAARTRIGDADPVLAIADALAGFPADEVLLVGPGPRPAWLRKSSLDRARAAFRVPIEHITASPDGSPV